MSKKPAPAPEKKKPSLLESDDEEAEISAPLPVEEEPKKKKPVGGFAMPGMFPPKKQRRKKIHCSVMLILHQPRFFFSPFFRVMGWFIFFHLLSKKRNSQLCVCGGSFLSIF